MAKISHAQRKLMAAQQRKQAKRQRYAQAHDAERQERVSVEYVPDPAESVPQSALKYSSWRENSGARRTGYTPGSSYQGSDGKPLPAFNPAREFYKEFPGGVRIVEGNLDVFGRVTSRKV